MKGVAAHLWKDELARRRTLAALLPVGGQDLRRPPNQIFPDLLGGLLQLHPLRCQSHPHSVRSYFLQRRRGTEFDEEVDGGVKVGVSVEVLVGVGGGEAHVVDAQAALPAHGRIEDRRLVQSHLTRLTGTWKGR